MKKNSYRFTNRAERIIDLLKEYDNIIQPYHFLIGACEEATGVCGELFLYLYQQVGSNFMKQVEEACEAQPEEYIEWNELNITFASLKVLERANEKKENYGQTLINEGHILFAVLELEKNLRNVLSKEMLNHIFQIACTPRDLTVHLDGYLHKPLSPQNEIRRVTPSDLPALKNYIRVEFGERWLEHVNHASNKEEIPIFIAERNNTIIGFACYDLVRNQKSIFGPMGTSKDKRCQLVGRELLDTCLVEMANLRYPYAIIDEAGPVEFYEKACNAKLIPVGQ
ncbi:acetyltransferase [Pontibacillus chungwhensis BH030062]|uniref:Acetyltransferase n=1 Tax=Pontibacillus chungwhensis BH030062 TaxID=1385513 RepID=A0A0A2UV59_9BACI|nr:GNAT family N-acetyltransferase [Pontibacillus chungwhensis]KGP91804.1 acetyltransferase [Pontibacillus chungwhensis BH030062]